MYDLIDTKRSVRKLYTESLIGRGDITVEEAEQALQDYQEQLGEGLRRDPRRPLAAGSGQVAETRRPSSRCAMHDRRSPRRP